MCETPSTHTTDSSKWRVILPSHLEFADDLTLIGFNTVPFKRSLPHLSKKLESVGLSLSAAKSAIKVFNNLPPHLKLDGQPTLTVEGALRILCLRWDETWEAQSTHVTNIIQLLLSRLDKSGLSVSAVKLFNWVAGGIAGFSVLVADVDDALASLHRKAAGMFKQLLGASNVLASSLVFTPTESGGLGVRSLATKPILAGQRISPKGWSRTLATHLQTCRHSLSRRQSWQSAIFIKQPRKTSPHGRSNWFFELTTLRRLRISPIRSANW